MDCVNLNDQVITLSTFPDEDRYYSKEFTISISYAREKVLKWFNMSLEEFLGMYTWDWTEGWPELAEQDGKLISLENVE